MKRFLRKIFKINKYGWKYFWQRRTRGFSDDETWGLNTTIATFIVPRLKRFKELYNGWPDGMTPKEWDDIIDKMIWSFEYIIVTGDMDKYDEWIIKQNRIDKTPHEKRDYSKDQEKSQEGLDLFAKYVTDLWW